MKGTRILSVIGVIAVLSSIPASTATAQEATTFGGYTSNALGAGFTVFPSLPATLPYVDEPAEGTLAHGLASLTSGGFGFGRASSVWPGTPVAGIRPLFQTASGQRLPIPDYPLMVESNERDDPERSDVPGFTMQTDVDPDRAEVISAMNGTVIPGLFGAESVHTTSRSELGDGLLVAHSISRTDGFSAAEGVVAIESVVSTSKAQSDSTSGACEGGLTVTGLTVGGVPATVDESGVHASGESVVPGLDPNDQIETALAASGVTIRVLGGTEDCDGPAASRTTGGLLVSVPLPGVGGVPPGGSMNAIIGRTTAEVAATPALTFDFDSPIPATDDPPVIADVAPRVPGPSGAGTSLAATEPAAAPEVPDRFEPPAAVPSATAGFEPIEYSFAGVPATLVVGMLLLAVPGSRRIRRYLERIMAAGTGAGPTS